MPKKINRNLLLKIQTESLDQNQDIVILEKIADLEVASKLVKAPNVCQAKYFLLEKYVLTLACDHNINILKYF